MSEPQAVSQDKLSRMPQDAEGVLMASRPGARAESSAELVVAPEALRALPAEFVKRHRILPFKIQNGTLHVATAELGNQRVIDDIRLLSGLEVHETEITA